MNGLDLPELTTRERKEWSGGGEPDHVWILGLRGNRLLLSSVNRALTSLGLPNDEAAIDQYRTLFDLIARHPIDSAAEYLRDHVEIIARRNLARMKIVAVISETGAFASYLVPQ